MLVLSRRRGQSIVIGEVRVTVVAFVGGGVRLSIAAPRDVPVNRKEVYERRDDKHPQAVRWEDNTAGIVTTGDDRAGRTGCGSEPSHLLLWRRCDQTIMIGDDVALTVVHIEHDVRGDKVRLGVDAPRHIPVHRLEVYDAISRGAQRRQVAQAPTDDPQSSVDDQDQPPAFASGL